MQVIEPHSIHTNFSYNVLTHAFIWIIILPFIHGFLFILNPALQLYLFYYAKVLYYLSKLHFTIILFSRYTCMLAKLFRNNCKTSIFKTIRLLHAIAAVNLFKVTKGVASVECSIHLFVVIRIHVNNAIQVWFLLL